MPQNKWASLRTACLLYEPHSQGSWQEVGTSLSILATRKSRATKGSDFSSITAHLPTFPPSESLGSFSAMFHQGPETPVLCGNPSLPKAGEC